MACPWMVPPSTSHFSLPILTHPLRSLPLNKGTQSSPGSLGLGLWALSKAKKNTGTNACSTSNKVRTLLFCSQLRPDFRRDMVGELLDSLQVRALHHYARQRLGSREPHQHATGISKRLLGIADGRLHARQFLHRLPLAHPNIEQALRMNLQVAGQLIPACARRPHHLAHA